MLRDQISEGSDRLLEIEKSRFKAADTESAMWMRFCPQNVADNPVLQALKEYLDRPETLKALFQCENSESYPTKVISEMQSLGLSDLFTCTHDDHAQATAYHLSALNLLTSRVNASLAITVGVNTLAILPAYRGASEAQLEIILHRVSEGDFCALALSELENGSDLAANASYSEPGIMSPSGTFGQVNDGTPPTHYRLQAYKQLINGGVQHRLLFVLLRDSHKSQAEDSPQQRLEHNMFWVQRNASTQTKRWKTGPVRAADISEVRLNDVVVGARQRIGQPGHGLGLIKESLAISRGGVCALSVGVLSHARDLATAYAAERQIKGARIGSFGAIARHLCEMDAITRVATALSLRATAWVNAAGERAAPYTAVAKFLGCRLAEEGVTEGRHILGARALLRDLPFERLIEDVLLFGVFDGTSHLMLDELQTILSIEARRFENGMHVAQDTIETIRSVYREPPRSLVRAGRISPTLRPFGVAAHAANLAQHSQSVSLEPLAKLGLALMGLCSEAKKHGKWHNDQALRFSLAEAYACLDASIALAEIFDPDLRKNLMDRPVQSVHSDDVGLEHAMGWIGGRACMVLMNCLAETGLTPPPLIGSDRPLYDELSLLYHGLQSGQDERRIDLAHALINEASRNRP